LGPPVELVLAGWPGLDGAAVVMAAGGADVVVVVGTTKISPEPGLKSVCVVVDCIAGLVSTG
jgi:hypothetical protein